MATWEYFPEEYGYRKNGRKFSETSILRNLDKYNANLIESTGDLAFQLRDGDITLQRWTTSMRDTVKRAHIAHYIIARGGRSRMTQSDWGRIGWVLRNQYAYLNNFAYEIAAGNLTVEQIRSRSALYINSARQSYERGKTQGARNITLPAYPGDGSTECLTNCRCRWSIVDAGNVYECTWKLSEAEHCATCVMRSEIWSPLIIPK